MDSIQEAVMGDQQTPQPHQADTPDGAQDHSLSEVTDHFEERNDVCQQKTGTDVEQLTGKETT
jgi:hypothetical protein